MSVRGHNGPASFAVPVAGLRAPVDRLRVRLTERSTEIRLRGQHPLVSSKAATCWAQLAKVGHYKGHWSGEEFPMDLAAMRSFVANFEAQANAIPLKYEHPMGGNGEPIPAAGWIHRLQIRGEWLWGFVEFTERAAKMVRDGEYRFTSIVFALEEPNRVTGKDQGPTLFEVGLVNNPFIDGQQPLSL